jgi:hypothetical protein
MRYLCPLLVLGSFLFVGCGGSSDGGRAVLAEGVYSSNADVPGIGPAMLIVTVDSRGRGKVMVNTDLQRYRDEFVPRSSGTTLRDEVDLLASGESHIIELSQSGNVVQATVRYRGQSVTSNMSRSAFAKAGDAPPVNAGSIWQTSAAGSDIWINIDTIQADGQGGWTITGTVVVNDSETVFGNTGYPSDITGDCLTVLSPGGSIFGSKFPGPDAASTTISFFGSGGGSITQSQ